MPVKTTARLVVELTHAEVELAIRDFVHRKLRLSERGVELQSVSLRGFLMPRRGIRAVIDNAPVEVPEGTPTPGEIHTRFTAAPKIPPLCSTRTMTTSAYHRQRHPVWWAKILSSRSRHFDTIITFRDATRGDEIVTVPADILAEHGVVFGSRVLLGVGNTAHGVRQTMILTELGWEEDDDQ